jgi:hypothetical protein
MVHVVERLPSKPVAMRSVPVPPKEKEKKQALEPLAQPCFVLRFFEIGSHKLLAWAGF